MTRKATLRVLKIGGAAAAAVFFGRSLSAAWNEVVTASPHIAWARAGLALFALTGAYLWFAWLWRRIARDLGTHVSYKDAVQLWAFSNLGRYVPGKVWQVIGLVVVARDLGISGALAASVAVVALGYTIASGALVCVVAMPSYLADHAVTGVVVALSAATLLIPLAWPGVIRFVLARLRVSDPSMASVRLTRTDTVRLTASFVVMWMVHGLTFMLLLSSLVDVEWRRFLEYAGVYGLSYVAGIVAIFAPGGIGVRENVLSHLLQSQALHADSANVLALFARAGTVVGESAMLVIALVIRCRQVRPR